MTMCTTSKCSSTAGVSLLAGLILTIAAVAVVVTLSRHHGRTAVNPQEETDRRIDELEKSLHHLQRNFSDTVKG